MRGKQTSMPGKKGMRLYERIRQIMELAQTSVARTVNTTQVVANWLIGREIVEEEQKGRRRADYGEQILKDLSTQLTRDFGAGYSIQNLRFIRQLYLTYPALLDDPKIRYALRSESVTDLVLEGGINPQAVCDSGAALERGQTKLADNRRAVKTRLYAEVIAEFL